MNKSELRTYYRNKRKEFTSEQIEQMSQRILENLQRLYLDDFKTFHLFQSIEKQNEVQTPKILAYLFHQNKKVVVPKVEGEQLINCLIHPETKWTKGKFDVPEPMEWDEISTQDIEVVFVPLLICDQKGNRIGYGGGFYDRFLSQTKPSTLKIGLNFFPPIEEIEAESFDVPLNYLVTPEEIVSFGVNPPLKFVK